jgi:hypothetical protein
MNVINCFKSSENKNMRKRAVYMESVADIIEPSKRFEDSAEAA